MKKRWKALIVVGGLFTVGLGYAAWYGFRTGGPLPSRESLRAEWARLNAVYMPEPKAGEPDAWATLQEATDARKAIDRRLWKPDVPDARPVPDFAWLGDAPPAARSDDEGDQERFKMDLQEKALAERCLAEYRAAGVIAKIDSLTGMKTGRSLDVPPPLPKPLLDMFKPYLSQMRFFARVNGARMRLAIEANDLEEFTRALRTNVALSRMAATGSTVLDRLVGIAIDALSEWAVLRAIQDRPQEPWLAAIEAELGRGAASIPFAHAMHGERVVGADAMLFARHQGSFGPQRVAIDAFATVTGTPPVGSPGENIAELESYYAAFEKLSAVPRPERESKEPEAFKYLTALPKYRMVQIIAPAMGKALDSEDQVTMKRSAVRLSLAIERYRLKHGKLPESLDALDPAAVKAAVDLWGGQPIRYRLAAAEDKVACGYILYSVGFDKTDNAGKHKSGGDMYDALKAKGAGYDFILNGPD